MNYVIVTLKNMYELLILKFKFKRTKRQLRLKYKVYFWVKTEGVLCPYAAQIIASPATPLGLWGGGSLTTPSSRHHHRGSRLPRTKRQNCWDPLSPAGSNGKSEDPFIILITKNCTKKKLKKKIIILFMSRWKVSCHTLSGDLKERLYKEKIKIIIRVALPHTMSFWHYWILWYQAEHKGFYFALPSPHRHRCFFFAQRSVIFPAHLWILTFVTMHELWRAHIRGLNTF